MHEMELSPPDADVLKPPWDNECVLCFGALSDQPLTNRAGCDSCQKEWCVECDLRWKLTRTQASLAPTCPFCRTSLDPPRTPSPDPDPIVRVLDPLLRIIAYLLLALVLLLLPLVEAYLTNSDEAFFAYFCLILFVFLFLCCHGLQLHCPAEEEEPPEDALSGV